MLGHWWANEMQLKSWGRGSGWLLKKLKYHKTINILTIEIVFVQVPFHSNITTGISGECQSALATLTHGGEGSLSKNGH